LSRLLGPVLWPLSRLYGTAVSFRNRRYDREPSRVGKLPVGVVSVGNLTVGGSGKTPVVAVVARELLARGDRVAVVSRGYGRRSTAPYVLVADGNTILASCEESGDEPLELARDVPGLAVAVGPDRLECGQKLLEALGPHVLVLDDGFQHRRLHRDLDLVCFDSGEAASSLRLLPLGRLREPLSSLARADAVVLTRFRESDSVEELRSLLSRAAGRELVTLRARSRFTGFSRVDGPALKISADGFRDRPVGVLLGIARPDRVLEAIPARVVTRLLRRDHHWWRAAEIHSLAGRARRAGAEALLTTGKDAVKIRGLATESDSAFQLPIFAMHAEAEILDLEALRDLLKRVPAGPEL
jgi:tetraacyldisaccharide 4'-kinase